ncbi:MAG: glycosyltransferase family 4 protein [Propionibacteriaceae bacterium]|nr:glycosyltransferase family 4 protein [Propionibacteriaceae bacterium]
MPTPGTDPRDPRTVCLISAVNPYPARAGKSVVLAGFVAYWSERIGADNVHYVLVDADEPDLAGFECRVHQVAPPRRSETLRALATRTLTGRAPIQESLLRGRSLRDALARSLAEIGPDLVVFDTVRLGQYARWLPQPLGQQRLIYLDDLMSERYRTMLAAGRRHRDIRYDALGNFARFVPGPVQPIVNQPLVQRALLRLEARLMARSEDSAARDFTGSLLINTEESELLRERAGSDRVRTAPPAIAAPSAERSWAGEPTLVCLGDLVLPHNDDGVRWFLTHCMADLTAALPGVRVRIIGKGARPDLVELAARFGNVSVEGYVEDLDAALGSAAAMLAPMRFGSGIKIKIVEAGGRGLPVVTSGVGAHGIGAGEGEGLVVAETPAEFVAGAVAVCDPETNARLSAAALGNYAARFAPAAVAKAYAAAFDIAGERRQPNQATA